MNIFLNVITIYLIALSTSAISFEISPRIKDGITLDTVKRFPYHVTIHPKFDKIDNKKVCSGSIISNRWILTSLGCVNQGSEYRIDFKRLFLNDSVESYSVILGHSSVTAYPTYFDDIALIHLPIILEFNDYIQPVFVHSGKDRSEDGKFAVMAGFGEDKNKLTYGMFETYSCKDEYLQMCTKGWGKGTHVPCTGNEGGGLIINWPQKPLLVGFFSNTVACQQGNPGVFTRIGQYSQWISSVIDADDNNDHTTAKHLTTRDYPTSEWFDPTTDYSTTESSYPTTGIDYPTTESFDRTT